MVTLVITHCCESHRLKCGQGTYTRMPDGSSVQIDDFDEDEDYEIEMEKIESERSVGTASADHIRAALGHPPELLEKVYSEPS